ncbi:MAG: hypothetical protein K8L97_13685 [Anaerolineae bacterium]|nr:hypothetical protein [Anaerolineae bacterium]
MRLKWLVYSLLLCLAPMLVLAQSDCPAIVQTALDSADEFCKDLGRNQACYGNVDLTAQPQAGVSDFQFQQTGDIVDVSTIQTMRLSPMDEAAGKWGVAVMKLQANLPDTLPGQNVTFLLFGDVELANAVPTDGSSDLKPMQAFYLKTGVGDSNCTEAPESGMLVQTPEGVGHVSFNVNGVDVSMGSTVFFQVGGDDGMTISTLEGSAYVSAEEETQVIIPGTWVSIPMEFGEEEEAEVSAEAPAAAAPAPGNEIQIAPPDIEELVFIKPAGRPGLPLSYEGRRGLIDVLPFNLLERDIEVAPPLSEADVQILWELIQTRRDLDEPLCGFGPLPDCEEFDPSIFDDRDCVFAPRPGDPALPLGEDRPFCDEPEDDEQPPPDDSGDDQASPSDDDNDDGGSGDDAEHSDDNDDSNGGSNDSGGSDDSDSDGD